MTKCEHGTPACSSCYAKNNFERDGETLVNMRGHNPDPAVECWCSLCTAKAAAEANEKRQSNKARLISGYSMQQFEDALAIVKLIYRTWRPECAPDPFLREALLENSMAAQGQKDLSVSVKPHPMAGFPTPHISGLAPLPPLKPYEVFIKLLIDECIKINAYITEQQKANKFSHEHMITLTVANNESFALLIKEVGNA